MQNGNRKSRGWPYVLTGVLFAGICAWISYNDGLFVTQLAGNAGRIVYFYPLVPDVLIVICLLALREAASAGVDRSRWAVAGLRLGIALTLAMNIYAGWEHSVLAAIQDGAIPIVFFIAIEVVLWHVRHGRNNHGITEGRSATPGMVPSPVFTDAQTAALAMLERTTAAGNPLSQNKLMTQFRLSRGEAREVCELVERGRGGSPTGVLSPAPAAQVPPAGELPPQLRPAPAGASLNGHGAHG